MGSTAPPAGPGVASASHTGGAGRSRGAATGTPDPLRRTPGAWTLPAAAMMTAPPAVRPSDSVTGLGGAGRSAIVPIIGGSWLVTHQRLIRPSRPPCADWHFDVIAGGAGRSRGVPIACPPQAVRPTGRVRAVQAIGRWVSDRPARRQTVGVRQVNGRCRDSQRCIDRPARREPRGFRSSRGRCGDGRDHGMPARASRSFSVGAPVRRRKSARRRWRRRELSFPAIILSKTAARAR